MTDQRHATDDDDHAPDYYAPEPSVPTNHGSFELTEDTVIIYGEGSAEWLWTDGAVPRAENR